MTMNLLKKWAVCAALLGCAVLHADAPKPAATDKCGEKADKCAAVAKTDSKCAEQCAAVCPIAEFANKLKPANREAFNKMSPEDQKRVMASAAKGENADEVVDKMMKSSAAAATQATTPVAQAPAPATKPASK